MTSKSASPSVSRAESRTLPLAVSCGEPSGIGPDVVLTTWLDRANNGVSPFYVIGDVNQLSERAITLGFDVPIKKIRPNDAISEFSEALPVCQLENGLTENAGVPLIGNAAGVVEAIDRAVADVVNGRAAGVVTAPIAKKPLYDEGFKHPGHTEYLAELAKQHFEKSYTPVMMIAGPDLRTIPVTIHIPLHQVPSALTKEAIFETVQIAHFDLKNRFGIESPRIAVSGLNPHAGEDGAMGSEDADIIAPAIAQLIAAGIDVRGPLPADTMFHADARAGCDVAVCMYHDQALIPAKALGFNDAVNVTLGLPFIRTSPDHGTAFGIAGTGKAKPDSFVAALKMATEMAANSHDR